MATSVAGAAEGVSCSMADVVCSRMWSAIVKA